MNSDFADRFRTPKGIYLLSHSIGCMPDSAANALTKNYLEPWAALAGDAWPNWLGAIGRFNQSLANLLGGEAEDYCPQTNLSSGLTKILQSVAVDKRRPGMLATATDFPSMGFVLQKGQRTGRKLELLPEDSDPADPDTWAQHLREDIGTAFITHVHYRTGIKVPVDAIVKICRERGIVSIIDVAQSAGVVPFDVASWNADFVVGSCVKWLCGGPGAGYLWANPIQVEYCEPADVGWFSHANPFEFDIHNFEYAPKAARFWGGTPSVAPYITATAGLELLAEIGLEQISRHNRALSGQLSDAVSVSNLRSPVHPDDRGGTVIIAPKALDAVKQRLEAASVLFDERSGGIRLSPHIFNTAEQIGVAARCLEG